MITLCNTGMDDSGTLVQLICINTQQVLNFKVIFYVKLLNIVLVCHVRDYQHIDGVQRPVDGNKPNAIPDNERKCSTCNVKEDEYHFVLVCSMYNDLRTVYIPVYYRRRSNMQQFVELNENEDVNKKLCVFVHKACVIRSLHT